VPEGIIGVLCIQHRAPLRLYIRNPAVEGRGYANFREVGLGELRRTPLLGSRVNSSPGRFLGTARVGL
jgi:hypothetical protein